MSKGAEKEVKVELPQEIEDASKENLKMAKQVGQIPYVPNFGLQAAAFTPMQEASFAGTNDAASAFGLPTSSGTGMPAPQSVGGFSGYGTKDLYNNSLSQINPQVKALIDAIFGANSPLANPQQGMAGGPNSMPQTRPSPHPLAMGGAFK